MQIKNIKLSNFRNYNKEYIEFENGINVIYGDNAQGKTNLIEAIFLCSMGKSFRTNKEEDLLKFNEDFAEVELEYEKKDRTGIIKLDINPKKTFFINGIKQKKTSSVVGKINTVLFTPDDINIVKGSPQKRRRFLDMLICSIKPKYMYYLVNHNKVLNQRNVLLKRIKEGKNSIDELKVWDEEYIELSKEIYNYRKKYTDLLLNYIPSIYKGFLKEKNKEELSLKYVSQLKNIEEFKKILEETKNQDILKGYTQNGINKDDLLFFINGKILNSYASQGQQRSTVLSLKLAEMQIIKDEIDEVPILLLDDFMSELDNARINEILKSINDTQVFITCTENIKVDNSLQKSFFVKNGKIKII